MDDNLIERGIAALERNAEATEKMLAIAEQEQIVMNDSGPGPSVCPHCGSLDPVVSQTQTGGSGRLSGFVMVAETHCCNKTLYAIPVGFDTVPTSQLAMDLLEMKGRANGE